jgi:hypothetical protein
LSTTGIAGECNTLLSVMDRTIRLKVSKETGLEQHKKPTRSNRPIQNIPLNNTSKYTKSLNLAVISWISHKEHRQRKKIDKFNFIKV